MRKLIPSCLFILCLIFAFTTCGSDPDQVDASSIDSSTPDASSDVLNDVVIDNRIPDGPKVVPPPGSFDFQGAKTYPITYHGGRVLIKPITVYFIWYGYWNETDTTPMILEELITNFGASGYQKINTEYYQECQTAPDGGIINPNCKEYVSPTVAFGKSVSVGYSYGPDLNGINVQNVVSDTITSKLLPLDGDGVYFVFTSKTVSDHTSYGSFCNDYCGYHLDVSVENIDVKYAFIGDPGICLDTCSPQSAYFKYGFDHSPNNNWSADAMSSVIVHELSEILVDPVGASWYSDDNGGEGMDYCSWHYLRLYLTSNGSVANYKIGSRDYLIQTTWDINSQTCILPQPSP